MIEIGGKQRPIAFPINALIELKNGHGVNVLESFNASDPEIIRAIGFVGLKYGHITKNSTPVDFTIEDVGNWMTIPKTKEVSAELIRQCSSDNAKGDEKPPGE